MMKFKLSEMMTELSEAMPRSLTLPSALNEALVLTVVEQDPQGPLYRDPACLDHTHRHIATL